MITKFFTWSVVAFGISFGPMCAYDTMPSDVHEHQAEPSIETAPPDTIYQKRTIDFTRPNGGYQRAFYLQDFGNDISFNSKNTITTEHARRMNTEADSWRVRLLANKIGNDGGMWTYATIGRSATTKTLEYDVKFGYVTAAFDWGWGGKILGLGGGKTYSGCVDTSDGLGWTSRLMWRVDEDGKAYLMPYIYHVDKPAACGDHFDAKYYGQNRKGLKSGQWYRVRMDVKMNEGSKHNGRLKISVRERNGDQLSKETVLLEKKDIRFATQEEGLVTDQLLTGVFRGGSTLDWATPKDDFIFFDNITWHD